MNDEQLDAIRERYCGDWEAEWLVIAYRSLQDEIARLRTRIDEISNQLRSAILKRSPWTGVLEDHKLGWRCVYCGVKKFGEFNIEPGDFLGEHSPDCIWRKAWEATHEH